MVDTSPDGLLAKLRLLSKRELQVLDLRCQGMKYTDIGKALSIAVPTVKTDMGRVYMKLGLDLIEPSQRLKTLYDTVGPLLESIKKEMGKAKAGSTATMAEPEVVEGEVVPEEEASIPPKVQDMVEEDGKAIVLSRPAPLVPPTPIPGTGPHPQPRRSPWIWVGAVVLGICCLGACAVFGLPALNAVLASGVIGSRPDLPNSQVFATEGPAAPVIVAPSTLALAATVRPPSVTVAPAATAALAPTQNAFVPPANGVLFQDSFDQGFDPSWQQLNGKWITLNGRATIIWEDYFYKWMNLDAPQWQNYRVDADLSRSAGQMIIAVRKRSLGYKFGFYGENCWVYTNDSDPACIIPNGNRFEQANAHLQITAQNNQYSASLNGVDTQSMTMAGSQSGGVSIGLWCENGFDCPSVDNFRVTYLP